MIVTKRKNINKNINKSVKKNVHSRKRGNKTRKNMVNLENMMGGGWPFGRKNYKSKMSNYGLQDFTKSHTKSYFLTNPSNFRIKGYMDSHLQALTKRYPYMSIDKNTRNSIKENVYKKIWQRSTLNNTQDIYEPLFKNPGKVISQTNIEYLTKLIEHTINKAIIPQMQVNGKMMELILTKPDDYLTSVPKIIMDQKTALDKGTSVTLDNYAKLFQELHNNKALKFAELLKSVKYNINRNKLTNTLDENQPYNKFVPGEHNNMQHIREHLDDNAANDLFNTVLNNPTITFTHGQTPP